jgi:hypothetical protein
MDVSWTVTAAILGSWLLATTFQVSDLGCALADLAGARRGLRGGAVPVRVLPVLWVPPVAVLALVALVLGIDRGGRLVFERGAPLAGLLLLLAMALAALLLMGALSLLQRLSPPPYAPLHDGLRRLRPAARPDRGDVQRLRRQLDALDEREGMRERAQRFVAGPGVDDAGIVRAVPWRSALAFLVRAGWWRLLPVACGLGVVAAALVAAVGTGRGGALAVLAFALPVASAVLGALGARLSLAAGAAWRLVRRTQRAAAVLELEALERRVARGVPGLSERVSRALRILRERAD